MLGGAVDDVGTLTAVRRGTGVYRPTEGTGSAPIGEPREYRHSRRGPHVHHAQVLEQGSPAGRAAAVPPNAVRLAVRRNVAPACSFEVVADGRLPPRAPIRAL